MIEELSDWHQKLPWNRPWIKPPPCNSQNTAKIQVYAEKSHSAKFQH